VAKLSKKVRDAVSAGRARLRRGLVTSVLDVVGCGLIVRGVEEWSRPAAWVVAGVSVLAVSVRQAP